MSMDNIVVVNVTGSAPPVTQASFDIIMVAAYHTLPDRVMTFESPDDVDTAFTGAGGNAAIRAACAAAFASSPRVPKVKVGKVSNASTKVFTLAPVAAINSKLARIVINDLEADFTTDGTATVQEIVEGLKAAIDALAITGVTTSEDNTTLTITGAAGTWFHIEAGPECGNEVPFTITETTADAGYAASLALIQQADSDWFGLVAPDHSDAVINAVGAWALTNKKLYGASTQDTIVATSSTTDIGSDLETASNNLTFLFYHQNPGSFPEAAAMGKEFPYTGKENGHGTYMFKILPGIAATTLTSTERGHLDGKSVNYISAIGGRNIVINGKVSSGSFIDKEAGDIWYKARLQERAFAAITDGRKIPYEKAGLNILEQVAREQVKEAQRYGFIAKDRAPVFTVIEVADQNANDRANRIMRGIRTEAYYSGAVHKAEFDVVLST